MTSSRLFAVVPAAGKSRRMGRPKLLLPLGNKTVIARLLEALDQPEVAAVFVVHRADDLPLSKELASLASPRLQTVVPHPDPPEMRDSVECALETIQQQHAPADNDALMLIPADHPIVSPPLVRELIHRWQLLAPQPDIAGMVPTHHGRRGHPVIFKWSVARQISNLPPDQGINVLLRRLGTALEDVPFADPAILFDLDTPDDYQRLLQQMS